MSLLFVSDLHLEDSRPDITRAFFHLLESFQHKIKQLYLLGDIFEVWLGDDTPMQCAELLAAKLTSLANHSVEIFLMHGNRDFLIGDEFAARCGATLIQEPYFLTIGNHKAALIHGDALCTQDVDYLAFRNMVRNPEWQRQFLAKSLPERIAIGRQLRDKSKESAASKQAYIMDVTETEVTSCMLEWQVDLLIHGHTHRPAIHDVSLQNGSGTRMVLGDWYQQGWYIVADDSKIDLQPFPFTD